MRVATRRGNTGAAGKKGGLATLFTAETRAEVERLIGVGPLADIDFEAVETAAKRAALQIMGQAIAQSLNADPSDDQGSHKPCDCGQSARYRGRRPKTFITALGPMRLERAWYHCQHCHQGFSPRDRALGLKESSLSPAALRMTGVTAARVSFAETRELLQELAGLEVDPKQVERSAEALGGEIAQDELRVIEPEPLEARTLYLGLDGTGVPVRRSEREGRQGKQPDGSAKTREAKVVTSWTCERLDPSGIPVRDRDSVTYSAAIETVASRDTDPDPAPFVRRVIREAERRGFNQAERRVILGDGAAWIWNLADEHFPGAVQIVDSFHAKGHLFDVAKAIYGPGTDLAHQWGKQRRDELDQGRIEVLGAALRAHADTCEEARKCLDYITGNRHRMRYPKFRALGLCVTTGVVEAGCKNIVGSRLKRGGMHWTVDGANAIMALRCSILSNRFDDFWERREIGCS